MEPADSRVRARCWAGVRWWVGDIGGALLNSRRARERAGAAGLWGYVVDGEGDRLLSEAVTAAGLVGCREATIAIVWNSCGC